MAVSGRGVLKGILAVLGAVGAFMAAFIAARTSGGRSVDVRTISAVSTINALLEGVYDGDHEIEDALDVKVARRPGKLGRLLLVLVLGVWGRAERDEAEAGLRRDRLDRSGRELLAVVGWFAKLFLT